MSAFRFCITLVGALCFISMGNYPVSTYYPSRSKESVPDYMELAIISAYAETGVPVEYIRGIVAWECGNDLSVNVTNRNGTVDHGPGLNSRWLNEYAWKYNKGKKVDPHSLHSITIVAKILANNYKVFNEWDMTLTSYRRGVRGAIKHGIDYFYVNNVKRLGTKL